MSESKLHGVNSVEIVFIDGLCYPKVWESSDECSINRSDLYNIRVYNPHNGGHYWLERNKNNKLLEEGEEVVVFTERRNEIGGHFLRKIVDKDPARLEVVKYNHDQTHVKFKGSWGGYYGDWTCWKVVQVYFPKN